jgi:hypothetical protein
LNSKKKLYQTVFTMNWFFTDGIKWLSEMRLEARKIVFHPLHAQITVC